jgi:DNA-binding beta-propeller fold protein YncE
VKRTLCACLLATVVAFGLLPPLAAEGLKFKYLASVYVDEKDVGLNLPEAVACGANGVVVVGDTGNDRLLRFTFRDDSVSGGSEVKIPQLSAPYRLQLNSKGEIYVLDGKQRRIVHLGANGEFKSVLALAGVPPPSTIVPKGIAIDAADNIYVLDIFSARVLVLNAQEQFQKSLALPADAGFVSDVAVDVGGSVILLDSIRRRLFAASRDATSFTPLGDDLARAIPTLPAYMTASRGTIFVVEGSGGSIAGLGRDGSFLSRQLTTGVTEGTLNHPSQICLNDKDEVFVADRDNSRIQVFRLTR